MITRGARIYCKKCNDLLFFATEDIMVGGIIGDHNTQSLQGHKTDDKLLCKKCKTPIEIDILTNWVRKKESK